MREDHDASRLENCSGISDIKMLDKMARTVKVDGEDTSVKSLQIKDNTGSCKNSLWRDLGKRNTAVEPCGNYKCNCTGV